jgi:serine/threonine-protein kinase
MYAGAYTLAHFGQWLAITVGGGESPVMATQHLFALAAIGMGWAVFRLSRTTLLEPGRLLDVGLVFNVVGAFGIAINEFWRGFYSGPRPFTGIPWEAAWILLFPLVAPHSPRKVLVASLLAASTGPLTVLLAGRAAGTSHVGPPVEFVSYFLFTSYLCAVVAWILARILWRYGVRLKEAREIGSYELVAKLGEGGMGEVWMARHRLLARPAAIKLIRPDLLGSSERSREVLIRRFEREARETAQLGSPHTVNIYDFGVAEDGSFYYVMELLEGETLEAHVRRFGPVAPARAVYLLQQICHSLGEAHARGLIHRDIKPANIFVCRLGPDHDFVKVLDFGLVKHTTPRPTASLVTVEGVTAGTPAYMPPELAMGTQAVDSRSDIYALGCVAYFLLSGRPVFTGETPVATILAHVRNQPASLSEPSSVSIPPALESVVMACLEKDPARRPATVADVAERLAASVPGEPWSAAQARRWWQERADAPPVSPQPADAPPQTLVPERLSSRLAAH